MKRFLVCLLALLCLIPVLACCSKNEDETDRGIVGVWRSEELAKNSENDPTSSVSQRLVYAFAENGHMLSIDLYADQITGVIGAHYEYGEDGILTIRQYGKDDGELRATLKGDTLVLAVNIETGSLEEDEEDLSKKSITFTREKDPAEAVILGNWLYAYVDENGQTVSIQYAFSADGSAARAVYKGEDVSSGMLTDYLAQRYTIRTVNGEEVLYLFTENAEGAQANAEVFRFAFPYDGYMTMEPLSETEGVTEVLPFSRIVEEDK